MAAWGAPDSQRGSADSSMSSHIPSGMTGLPSILQGTVSQPAATCIGGRVRLHSVAWASSSWPQDVQACTALLQHRSDSLRLWFAKPLTSLEHTSS